MSRRLVSVQQSNQQIRPGQSSLASQYAGPLQTDADLQRNTKYSETFLPCQILTFNSNQRILGTISNATYSWPRTISEVFALSLKSLTIPNTFPNVPVAQTLSINQGGAHSVTVPVGAWTININQGTLTYTFVNANPGINLGDLSWFLLRGFGGLLTSIAADPTTGLFTWTWAASTTSTSSTAVMKFFGFSGAQSGSTWTATT